MGKVFFFSPTPLSFAVLYESLRGVTTDGFLLFVVGARGSVEVGTGERVVSFCIKLHYIT